MLGIRDLKAKLGPVLGLKVCVGGGVPKITLGITGLHKILGRDYGIEEFYWVLSNVSAVRFTLFMRLVMECSSLSGLISFQCVLFLAIAEVYNNEGNEAYLKGDYSNAIYFFTEGIKVSCKDIDLKCELYSNRAYANLCLGEAIWNLGGTPGGRDSFALA